MVHRRASARHHRELLLALEAARTRLAVAIAAETKSTTPDRRRNYFETAERARRFMKKLRNANSDSLHARHQCSAVVESLKQLPPHAEAKHLCRILGDIVTELDFDS